MSVISSFAGGSPPGKSTSGFPACIPFTPSLVPATRLPHPMARLVGGGVMVRVVVTGGAGFVGSRLARELLASGTLSVAGGPPGELSRVTIVDRVPPPGDLAADDRVSAIQTEITEVTRETLDGADAVFHLAAAVSGECEADFDLGLRANLRGTEAVLAACRALGTAPVVVFTSSYAVFGGSAIHPLPPVIDDQTPPNPQTSYGTQKAMLELLLADYTRKGYLRGRAMRLATISVRAGRPNTAASSFLSGIIREPLAGIRAVCPVPHGTEAALASPAKAVAALIRAATATGEEWGDNTAVTMPSLTTTVDEMAAALERVAGPEVSALIDWAEDPVVAKIVLGWPARVKADRAARLGLAPDRDVEEIIRRYIADSRTQLSRTEPWCQKKVHASASRAQVTGIWPRSCVTSSVSGATGATWSGTCTTPCSSWSLATRRTSRAIWTTTGSPGTCSASSRQPATATSTSSRCGMTPGRSAWPGRCTKLSRRRRGNAARWR